MWRCIGDDFREAVDWLQDRKRLSRPDAERAMAVLLREGQAVTTQDGILLNEDERELDRHVHKSIMSNYARKPRVHFRNHNRKTVRNRTSHQKLFKTDFSQEAEDMVNISSTAADEVE